MKTNIIAKIFATSALVLGIATANAATYYQAPSTAIIESLSISSAGTMYFSDSYSQTIQSVAMQGGFATPIAQASGINGTGSNAFAVSGIATDSIGNIYFVDSQTSTVSKITVSGIGTSSAPVIIAGTGTAGYSGDGGLASQATFNSPAGIAIDAADDIYIADMGNNVIRKISNGIISTIAGNGTAGFSGDNGNANLAQLNAPYGIAVDGSYTIYITEVGNHTVRRIYGGSIATIAGTGTAGFSGDGGLAGIAQFNTPMAITTDSTGAIYVADTGNNSIRKIDNLFISTVANPSKPTAITSDSQDNVYTVDTNTKTIITISTASNDTVNNPTASCIANSQPPFGVILAGLLFAVGLTRKRM